MVATVEAQLRLCFFAAQVRADCQQNGQDLIRDNPRQPKRIQHGFVIVICCCTLQLCWNLLEYFTAVYLTRLIGGLDQKHV